MIKIDRRHFLKSTALAGIASSVATKSNAGNIILLNDENTAMPSPSQKAWMDLKFGMFIHFGINTYYDVEWSDGTLDPVKFNPEMLDVDQWCRTARDAGMKYIVLITKHHDGFCLWPSKHTKYSVAATPWKGDLIAEVANAAQKHGLKLGLYYSLWDRHEKSHDENDWVYVDFMKKQLEELLTNYGDIIELWFDGFWKKQKNGWTKKDMSIDGEAGFQEKNQERDLNFITAWRMEGAYRWQMDHLYQFIKSIQPNCLVMNNATTSYPGVPLHPVDIRSGEKYTSPDKNDQKIWKWLGEDIYLPMQIETTMSVQGNKRFQSGNWFWHEWDHSVASTETIQNYLDAANAMQANLLLNCGPMANGLLRPEDVKTLNMLQK